MQDEQELAYQAVGRGKKSPGGGNSMYKGLQVKWHKTLMGREEVYLHFDRKGGGNNESWNWSRRAGVGLEGFYKSLKELGYYFCGMTIYKKFLSKEVT